ncbi:hypothetical protein OG874_07735 [Nocardia sp. NBC_00565]|uniref:aromatic-ring hydroxylase C-terminal domain-containing protein n=1 Tax=Nocardia sp. NBC_00565 TaxID=2975993 RepID=UPI002E80365A|nr:hypothetical protein [Nocardia sp. NBC_00565]WUC05034.1 hypothetical protein OG874_07735 [Nocardia sp. NBC_00565]
MPRAGCSPGSASWSDAPAVPAATRSADPALLDTYHAERHPVGWHIADQSSIRTTDLRTMNRESTDATPLADPIAMILGNRYRAGALIDDGSPSTMDHLDLTGQPGTRLPHRRLADGRSTLDLIGTAWALLAGPAGTGWKAAARPPLEVHELDHDWTDTVGLSPTGALLVRPDQIIAWRRPTLPSDPAAELRATMDRIFGRAR